MSRNISAIWQLRYYLGGVLLLSIAGFVSLLTWDKVSIHLTINSLHNDFFDSFFTYFTFVGDGLFVAVAGLIIALVLFPKYKWTPLWFGTSVLIVSGALAQVLKRFVFEDALRPSAFLSDRSLHLVEGVQVHAHHSFPSGHTTAGFAFFSFAALFLAFKRPWLQLIFAFCAGLVGYSRMYLSQHFLEDVLAGLFLGTFVFLLFVVLFKSRLKTVIAL